uniref:Uncharacterized protein n=1 Tax=Chromera velia CCMP2878 TaxID=1169474 RepID=A0A0G4F0Q0_9ALVE|eukprot:Cvel_14612.t1-p1 / transcript=Cvel_14612.t1 / gene=Cvel_14612 / organism=Chromera_velia_CCMP2878 / gene_product=hypothetical protein / transcript_product=hypothetical protein / location=Cvel_scaffold1045:4900-10557(-) / protein_length=842 / sequence_SO=supercontig / SO=protein_coding / is_pseudo=false
MTDYRRRAESAEEHIHELEEENKGLDAELTTTRRELAVRNTAYEKLEKDAQEERELRMRAENENAELRSQQQQNTARSLLSIQQFEEQERDGQKNETEQEVHQGRLWLLLDAAVGLRLRLRGLSAASCQREAFWWRNRPGDPELSRRYASASSGETVVIVPLLPPKDSVEETDTVSFPPPALSSLPLAPLQGASLRNPTTTSGAAASHTAGASPDAAVGEVSGQFCDSILTNGKGSESLNPFHFECSCQQYVKTVLRKVLTGALLPDKLQTSVIEVCTKTVQADFCALYAERILDAFNHHVHWREGGETVAAVYHKEYERMQGEQGVSTPKPNEAPSITPPLPQIATFTPITELTTTTPAPILFPPLSPGAPTTTLPQSDSVGESDTVSFPPPLSASHEDADTILSENRCPSLKAHGRPLRVVPPLQQPATLEPVGTLCDVWRDPGESDPSYWLTSSRKQTEKSVCHICLEDPQFLIFPDTWKKMRDTIPQDAPPSEWKKILEKDHKTEFHRLDRPFQAAACIFLLSFLLLACLHTVSLQIESFRLFPRKFRLIPTIHPHSEASQNGHNERRLSQSGSPPSTPHRTASSPGNVKNQIPPTPLSVSVSKEDLEMIFPLPLPRLAAQPLPPPFRTVTEEFHRASPPLSRSDSNNSLSNGGTPPPGLPYLQPLAAAFELAPPAAPNRTASEACKAAVKRVSLQLWTFQEDWGDEYDGLLAEWDTQVRNPEVFPSFRSLLEKLRDIQTAQLEHRGENRPSWLASFFLPSVFWEQSDSQSAKEYLHCWEMVIFRGGGGCMLGDALDIDRYRESLGPLIHHCQRVSPVTVQPAKDFMPLPPGLPSFQQ